MSEPNSDTGVLQATPTTQSDQETQEATVVAQTMTKRRPRGKGAFATAALGSLEQTRKHDFKIRTLHQRLNDQQMISNYANLARELHMSSTLAAAFRATPGFEQLVAKFPEANLFNIVAEHPSSPNNTMGLESLGVAETESDDVVKERCREVVAAFLDILAGMDTTIDNLQDQIVDDKEELASSDVTDEVMSSLSVHTLSNESFSQVLTKLGEYLTTVDTFNADDLRAHPEKIKDQTDGLASMIEDVGSVIGLSIGEYGLIDSERNEAFEPSPGDFGSKNISKEGLLYYLTQASSILDSLKAIADRKDELSQAVSAAVDDMPDAMNSDDVVYGRLEHVMLLTCYTTFVSKLIREAIVVVTMLLSTVDSALDVDDGVDD